MTEAQIKERLAELDRRAHEVYDHLGPAGQPELQQIGAEKNRLIEQLKEES